MNLLEAEDTGPAEENRPEQKTPASPGKLKGRETSLEGTVRVQDHNPRGGEIKAMLGSAYSSHCLTASCSLAAVVSIFFSSGMTPVAAPRSSSSIEAKGSAGLPGPASATCSCFTTSPSLKK